MKCNPSRFPATWPVFAPAKKVFHNHIPIFIFAFYAYMMILVSKLAGTLRGSNGDQHLDIYHCTQRFTGPENENLGCKGQEGGRHRARIPRQPRRVGDGIQRRQGVRSYLSRKGRSLSISGSVFALIDLICDQESFKGQVLHSLEHNKATDHNGKKVVVVGACTSGTRFTQ